MVRISNKILEQFKRKHKSVRHSPAGSHLDGMRLPSFHIQLNAKRRFAVASQGVTHAHVVFLVLDP